MFFSEIGVFIVYYGWLKKKVPDDPNDPRPKMPFYMGLVSVSLNLLGSPLFYIGLSMIAGSVFQMMNGSVVAFTAILSVIFLKKKYHRHHWTGVIAIVGGVALVGWGGMRAKNKSAAETSLLGILITLAGQAVYGTVYVVDEAIFRKYKAFPLKLLGWEGIFGAPIYACILIILQCIPCEGKLCPHGRVEDSLMALRQMRENPRILIVQLALMVSICCCLCFSMSVIKYASATQRTTVDTTRTVLVWAFFLSYTGIPQSHEKFDYVQLIGFIILIFGSTLFNEILVLPFWGYNKNLKKNEKKKEEESIVLGPESPDR